MSSQNIKQRVTDLIIKGRIKEALEEIANASSDKQMKDEITLQLANYNELSRKMRIQIIDEREAAIQITKIRMAILELADRIEELAERIHPPESKDAEESFSERDPLRKLALVIGCDDYDHGGTLFNPVNDAEGMETKLEQLGFTVLIKKNSDLIDLKHAVDDFGKKLKNFDVALFYFAGHGIQVNGYNYLIPIDADLVSEELVEESCLRVDKVLRYMEESASKVNIVILDACRNNPFERSWGRGQLGRGLALMDAPKGSLIAYATAPGKTASDGKGDNGLYTGELLKFIAEKDISINQLFQKVRKSVMDLSQERQVPWESTSLTSDFYFHR
jgi:hypothetical protein